MNKMINPKNASILKTIFFICFLSIAFGQDDLRRISSKIADCDGAVNLPVSGTFSVAFPGEPGVYADVDAYKSFFSFSQTNSVWLKFNPTFSGQLELTINSSNEKVDLGIFELKPDQNCDNILLGQSRLIHHQSLGKEPVVFSLEEHPFLARDVDSSKLYLYVNTPNKKGGDINFSISYSPVDLEKATQQLIQKVDLSEEGDFPTYTIAIRDEETRLPVSSRIVIDGSRNHDAMYNGTDLILPLDRSLKFDAKLDALGYFPKDTSVRITELKNTIHTLLLTPVSFGKQVELEGIEFLPQSAYLTQEAQGKLIRLRDFLALNANVKVEIQGHVHQPGRNTFRAKRLSKKRAKTVQNYLIRVGIDKSRVSFKGYGNEHMLYPEPETPQEEAANRRVEVKIL